MGIKPGDEIVLKLVDNAFGGEAVGRVNNLVVFVPFAIKGETVKVKIRQKKRRMLFADLLEVIESSPERTEPFCPNFGSCGGCQYQHINYPYQLEIFVKQLQDLLLRTGGFLKLPEILPALPSPKTAHYRNRIDLHPAEDAFGSPYYGFCKRMEPKTIFPLKECPIFALEDDFSKIPMRMEDKLLVLRTHSGKPYYYFKDNHNLVCSGPYDYETRESLGDEDVFYDVGDLRFFNSYSGFFQVNPSLLEVFSKVVTDFAQPRESDLLLDIYCGAGFFGISLANKVREVLGVEIDPSSIAYAKKNAQANGLSNCQYTADSAENYLRGLLEQEVKPDICILDPPRTGLTNKAVSAVKHLQPKRLIYISCGPPTFARDAAKFADAGYLLSKIQPLDLFPHTKHFELISLFEWKGKGLGSPTKGALAESEEAEASLNCEEE
ncbi:class I SAM-dependent RNA methyltransferase [bacterium]|nr:class I SAM-dependent RNA methyltransferase [bacterium]